MTGYIPQYSHRPVYPGPSTSYNGQQGQYGANINAHHGGGGSYAPQGYSAPKYQPSGDIDTWRYRQVIKDSDKLGDRNGAANPNELKLLQQQYLAEGPYMSSSSQTKMQTIDIMLQHFDVFADYGGGATEQRADDISRRDGNQHKISQADLGGGYGNLGGYDSGGGHYPARPTPTPYAPTPRPYSPPAQPHYGSGGNNYGNTGGAPKAYGNLMALLQQLLGGGGGRSSSYMAAPSSPPNPYRMGPPPAYM